MIITKQRLACLLYNAIDWLKSNGVDQEEIEYNLGITELEMLAIENRDVEELLTPQERYKIFLEVDAESKLQDIETRVRELWEGESLYLCGFTADQILGNSKMMNNILNRYERAQGWADNSSYWELLDECIKDEAEKESTRFVLEFMNNGG